MAHSWCTVTLHGHCTMSLYTVNVHCQCCHCLLSLYMVHCNPAVYAVTAHCTLPLHTVTIQYHCTLSLYTVVCTLYSPRSHRMCLHTQCVRHNGQDSTLALYTVTLHSLYALTLHCHCTLSLHTVTVNLVQIFLEGVDGNLSPLLCSVCLVTWHRSKNPKDGSCGTDCLQALPRWKPVVIRRDSRATT